GERFQTRLFDLADLSWRALEQPIHAVVSSLTIHHLDREGKQQLFEDMARLLEPGGVFLIADVIEPARRAGAALAAKARAAGGRGAGGEGLGCCGAPARAGDRRQPGCAGLFRARAVEYVPLPRPGRYRQALAPARSAQVAGGSRLHRGGRVLDEGWARAVRRA